MDIIRATSDPNLLLPYLSPSGDLSSWRSWLSFLKVLYGLKVPASEHDLIHACTGRDPSRLPRQGFDECLLLCGRRSGKSKTIALVGAYESVLAGRERRVSAGEIPMVGIISPTRFQSRIIFNYLRAVFRSAPILEREVQEERKSDQVFVLRNGVEIAVLTGSHQSARGFSLISCIVDEVAFFGLTEESKVKSDTELVRAVRPSLATTGGRLLCVGTPFKEAGYCWQTWKRAYGHDECEVLCWNAASTRMNPTLSVRVVERAVAEDAVAANVEYCVSPGLFRSDVDEYVSRQLVESLVILNRQELPPRQGISYAAFADLSGGRGDDAALAIGHKEDRRIVLDSLQRFRAPHNPYEVTARMTDTVRRYWCDRLIGDAYSAEWCRQAFASHGVNYRRCTTSVWKESTAGQFLGGELSHGVLKPKSQLYAELLPRLTSGEVELLDDDLLITQLASLQRRTRSGSRDSIDHPPGGHDDLANAVAGVCDAVAQRRVVAGLFDGSAPGDGLNRPSRVERELDRLARQRQFDIADLQRCNQPEDHNAEWREAMWRAGRADLRPNTGPSLGGGAFR
jgi:hypothetical protein